MSTLIRIKSIIRFVGVKNGGSIDSTHSTPEARSLNSTRINLSSIYLFYYYWLAVTIYMITTRFVAIDGRCNLPQRPVLVNLAGFFVPLDSAQILSFEMPSTVLIFTPPDAIKTFDQDISRGQQKNKAMNRMQIFWCEEVQECQFPVSKMCNNPPSGVERRLQWPCRFLRY
jgi:hypothetical protein